MFELIDDEEIKVYVGQVANVCTCLLIAQEQCDYDEQQFNELLESKIEEIAHIVRERENIAKGNFVMEQRSIADIDLPSLDPYRDLKEEVKDDYRKVAKLILDLIRSK